MGSVDCLRSLKGAYEDFRDCILSIPEDLYLSLIDRWSPRDIVAHLVGWNRNMIEACDAILRGEAPSYYVDAPSDYKNINAAFVARYSSQNKTELLNDLASSIEELQRYVGRLDQTELDADHGVAPSRPSEQPSPHHRIAHRRLPAPPAENPRMAKNQGGLASGVEAQAA